MRKYLPDIFCLFQENQSDNIAYQKIANQLVSKKCVCVGWRAGGKFKVVGANKETSPR